VNEFGYLSVLITIILGLGIAQLMAGFGRLIVLHQRVCLYWPTVAWVALLLIFHILTWWTMFGLRNYSEWNFLAYLIVLLQPIVLYLLAALILPDFTSASRIDLKTNYYGNGRWFFSLLVLFFCVSLLKDLALYGRLPEKTNLAAHVIFMVLGIAAIGTQREWYHKLLIPVSVALIGVYIATLFARLR
jgi:hypothetical protein